MIIHDVAQPSDWVSRFVKRIPRGNRVLDLACGSGRHARLLASLAYSVLAVDRQIESLKILEQSLSEDEAAFVQVKELDLEGDIWPLNAIGEFSGVIVTNYLYRPYMDELLKLLAPGGILIYETFSIGNEVFGKPSNPNFLLKPGELLAFALNQGLNVLAYEDIYEEAPKPAMVQRICTVKGEQNGRIPLQFHG